MKTPVSPTSSATTSRARISPRRWVVAVAQLGCGLALIAFVVLIWLPCNSVTYTFIDMLSKQHSHPIMLLCFAVFVTLCAGGTIVFSAMMCFVRYRNGSYLIASWALHLVGIVATIFFLLFTLAMSFVSNVESPHGRRYRPPPTGQALFAQNVEMWLPWAIELLAVLVYASLLVVRDLTHVNSFWMPRWQPMRDMTTANPEWEQGKQPQWALKVRAIHALWLGIPIIVSTIVLSLVAMNVEW